MTWITTRCDIGYGTHRGSWGKLESEQRSQKTSRIEVGFTLTPDESRFTFRHTSSTHVALVGRLGVFCCPVFSHSGLTGTTALWCLQDSPSLQAGCLQGRFPLVLATQCPQFRPARNATRLMIRNK